VAPGSDGAAEVDPLRFQQTVHGARVLWSQIDVMIAAGYVSSITATVVPVTGKRLAGKRKLSRKRALRIARNAVKGPDDALSPLRVAYAGQPTTRQKHSRTPRPAWVVEVTPAGALDEEVPTPLCVVVDAKTGEVVARWSGIADRPDRGQDSGDALASVRGSAQSSATTPVLDVYDGAGGTQGAPHYARFSPTGDPHVGANWPSLDEAQFFRPRRAELDTLAFNAANVARTICTVRDYCGRRGRFPGVLPWQVAGDVPGSTSSANLSRLIVSISENDVVSFNGFNDVVAHEMGHVRDWVTAGDRIFTEDVQVGAVQEALADMFSYDYDRGDATFGEETALGVARNWADPGAEQELGIPYPAHMRDFDTTRSSHFNSTIFSHAYYLFVQRVGHSVAGNVLRSVPTNLPPRPNSFYLKEAFFSWARILYRDRPDVREAAVQAFSQVGLRPLEIDPIPIPAP
jgi:Zn-dependent metalloprotease